MCDIGRQLQELAACEDDISADLDQIVKDLQGRVRQCQPQIHRGNQWGTRPENRSERTQRKITRHPRTQDLFRKNPTWLTELVLQNNLQGLDKEEERVDPPREESINLYS